MNRALIVEFSKMDGAGNDFVVLDNRFYAFTPAELSALATRLCRRRTSIGADGLVALCPPEEPDHRFRMRYCNADGSLGTMCGNGARCIVGFAIDAGLGADPIVFGSDAGIVYARETGLDAGAGARDIEITLRDPKDFRTDRIPLPSIDGLEAAAFVNTGTEHVVYRVRGDLASVPVEQLGRAIRRDAGLAPAGANVNFVQFAGGDQRGPVAHVRTYEKGVEAETLACGTGAAAVAWCGAELGWWGNGSVSIRMPGGTLRIGVARDGPNGSRITLAGPARTAFRGTIEIRPDDLAPASSAT